MIPLLELACTDEALARLETALATAPANQRLAALLPLAWQLRQRDTARALALADEVEATLNAATVADGERQSIAARLMLIRGEAKSLFGELDAGMVLAESALCDFTTCFDAIGCADAHWLLTTIAHMQGDHVRRTTELVAMAAAAEGGDPVRVTVPQAALAIVDALSDVASAKQKWGAHFTAGSADRHPAAAAWVENFFACVALFSGEHVDAIRHLGTYYTQALATGQIRRAIIATFNLSVAFNNLNDHHAALEWTQRGLDLARPRAWPGSMGLALMQSAETLRLLRRFDAARSLLHETMTLMAPIAASHGYAIALGYLANVELNLRNYDDALKNFQLLEQRAHALGTTELLCRALRGQAQALLQLEQPQAALLKAQAGLAAATKYADEQIAALRVLADIHVRHPLPPPPGMNKASPALHYLQQAHDVAAAITNFTISGDLLEALADEHAKTGDTAQAYQLAKQAIAAHAKIHNSEAANRASAMQISHEVQSVQAEGEHHRKLAAAHAERADALEQANSTLAQANNTLEQLGAVGRDITANLEMHTIFTALNTHVNELLDATSFGIYRLEEDGQTLRTAFGVEAGEISPSLTFRLDNQESNTARCARERSTLIIDFEPGESSIIPGTLDTLSTMFAPLLSGERLLGVMTVQTVRPHAYHARESAIFSTLCAYAAIALANTESQAKMVQNEKMASLGQLVANVAHEINTPIGAVKSSGANIADALDDMLINIPRLYKILDDDQQLLFHNMISRTKEKTQVLTSREERKLVTETTQQLADLGIPEARHQADVLVQLRAHANPARHLPLLRHPDSEFILATANSVASVINSTANINTAVATVSKIVFALKAFSRVDNSGKFIATHLQSGLDTVLTIYYNQIIKGTTLVQNYEEIPALRCLPDELNQVWTNLISNALHAMQYQGTLTLGIRQEGNMAVVSVGDSGCGIPEAIRNRVFEPFFTTKPIGEGSGLGLDIAKKIVAKHKGRIDVQSEVGVGTVFSVHLPYS
jgi:signal transduction histidine kinase/tetratricopeptide (TPR) repeat protein